MSGFKVYKTDDGRVMPAEYFPADGLTPKLGMALVLKSGLLAAASGADAPAYVSMTERRAACAGGERIPVLRVGPDVIWETGADLTVLAGKKLGDTVQLSEDGMTVTAAAGGAAEIVGLGDASAADGRVLVRFTKTAADAG